MSSHICQNSYHQQINKQQGLARMWKKGNPHALLVGKQTGAATVKTIWSFLKKIKNEPCLVWLSVLGTSL